ncbi:MAG: CDP-glucose 4,6-dehydratase [Acidobacteriaceae bacterium]
MEQQPRAVEGLVTVTPAKFNATQFWSGKRVFLTGHTGFKGSWLALWLQHLGAELTGYALDPPTEPSLFHKADVAACMQSIIGDLRDAPILTAAVQSAQPEIVFHLAAQPLVRHSYEDPVGTYETNVLGTIHLLEAVRKTPSVRAVVVITTDKCYENKEWIWPYRETDPLGGYDPYSSSKACAEIVTSSWRNSFFNPEKYAEHKVAVASARAGNVIGGGDWASDRLIADIVRAFSSGNTLEIRNPAATRPWQHVLEPLRGYLTLAEKLHADGPRYASAWNFGPRYTDAQPVEWIVRYLSAKWGSAAQWKLDAHEHVHEAQMLKLDWSKAHAALGWQPVLALPDALDYTFDWYHRESAGARARELCLEQIASYFEKLAAS